MKLSYLGDALRYPEALNIHTTAGYRRKNIRSG